MEVTIIEKESGKIIANYPIYLDGLNYTPSENEYFSEAWRNAVDDNEVPADSRDKYDFRLNK